MCDYEKMVPEHLRGHFVAAYKGVFGYWFEFDGSVSFQDPQGGGVLPFAYGTTIDECRNMMENFTITKGTKSNEQDKRTAQPRRRADRVHRQPGGKGADCAGGRGRGGKRK